MGVQPLVWGWGDGRRRWAQPLVWGWGWAQPLVWALACGGGRGVDRKGQKLTMYHSLQVACSAERAMLALHRHRLRAGLARRELQGDLEEIAQVWFRHPSVALLPNTPSQTIPSRVSHPTHAPTFAFSAPHTSFFLIRRLISSWALKLATSKQFSLRFVFSRFWRKSCLSDHTNCKFVNLQTQIFEIASETYKTYGMLHTRKDFLSIHCDMLEILV